MKKQAFLILVMILSFSFAFAQTGPTWDGLIKDLESSNEEIEHDRKKDNPRTWFKRAELFYEIHVFNSAGLSVGMPAEEGIVSLKTMKGTPNKIEEAPDGSQIWVYPRMNIYVAGGAVQRWEETEFIDGNAIIKAGDALLVTVDKDDKNRWESRNNFQMLNMQVRTEIVNKGISLYQDEKFGDAYKHMEKAIKLAELPKMEADTNYNYDVLSYYAGLIALSADKPEKAKEHFYETIRLEYSPGISYHYLAEAYNTTDGEEKYIETVQEGFQKYPDEEQLVIDMINYYIGKEQPDKVIEYIDYAIEQNPGNPSYYSAKATIFDNRDDAIYENYKVAMDSVHEYKKLAFQNRFDNKKKTKYENLQAKKEKEAKKYQEESQELFKKADELYAEALEKDPKFYNAAFNRGRLYYKLHERRAAESDQIFRIYRDSDRADEIQAEVEPLLKKSAEYFTVAHEANPTEVAVVEILRTIYFRLRDKEMQEKYLQKLQELNE